MEVTPQADGLYQYLVVPFGLSVILTIIFSLKARRAEEVFKKVNWKLANLFAFIGFLGLALIFFRWQKIPYLGSRLLLLILVGISLIWVLNIIRYKLFVLPKEMEKFEKKKIFEKYLP